MKFQSGCHMGENKFCIKGYHKMTSLYSSNWMSWLITCVGELSIVIICGYIVVKVCIILMDYDTVSIYLQ